MKNLSLPVSLAILCVALACNKNSNQLPPPKAPPQKLSIASKLNGIAVIDFIFEKNTSADSGSVKLYIRNNTNYTLNRLQFVVELCKAAEKNYYNCDLQLVDSIKESILPGKVSNMLYEWNNKNIQLEENRISTGIISYNGISPHPLANAYSNIYAHFEGDTQLYGAVRGYILADGKSTFRYRTIKGENYNAEGLFTSDKNIFNGQLYKVSPPLSVFMLDSVTVSGIRKLIDESNGNLLFRLNLTPHLYDSTRSIFTLVKKYY